MAPRAQQGRIAAWSPSSVREVPAGSLRPDRPRRNEKARSVGAQAAAEPAAVGMVDCPRPHFRIVAGELWSAAQARLTGSTR